MKQTEWFDRKFNFDHEQHTFLAVFERLSGTLLRIEAKLEAIPSAVLTDKIDGTWSIKENIGHLIDLEPLWQSRLLDLKKGKRELGPADLNNTKTNTANHNERPIAELVDAFRQLRQATLDLLKDVDEPTLLQSALHPRLKIPMRIEDLCYFVAEHDDHHLARMTQIMNISRSLKTS